MIGLAGTRVVVVDDSTEEALPILKAFAQKGIPTAFFDGNLKGLPSKTQRLYGVRLAILDMDLTGGGVQDKSKASALVKVLERIVSLRNGPYAVIAWTNHPELLKFFEDYIFSTEDVPKPIFSVMITKAECKDSKGDLKLDTISKKLEDAFKQLSPLQFLQAWEEKCFIAATEVTNALSSLDVPKGNNPTQWRESWKTQLLQLMHAMAKAEAEKHLDDKSCLDSFYRSLNPLHADRMERNTAELANKLKGYSSEILAASASSDIRKKASVNKMLHLSLDNLKEFNLGNIFLFPDEVNYFWLPDKNEFLEDLMQPGRKGKNQEESKKEIPDNTKRILIEINPNCDHAQKNVRIPRFIAGLLVPNDLEKQIKKAGFIWKFGPVFFDSPMFGSNQYFICLSARHLITLSFKQTKRLKAIARLRSQAMSDLQSWFFHQAARPGMMLLK